MESEGRKERIACQAERSIDHVVLPPYFIGEEKGEETLLLLLLVIK